MAIAWVCLALFQNPAVSTSPYFHPIKWLITLAGTIIATAGAVAIDNIIKRLRDTRSHNFTQLVNEILAEHQVAYPLYFVALLTAADFKEEKFWIKDVLGILVFVAFISYAIGVYLTTLHQISRTRSRP